MRGCHEVANRCWRCCRGMKRVERTIADFFTTTKGPEKDVTSCEVVRTYGKRKRYPEATTSAAFTSPRKITKKESFFERKKAPQLHLDVGQKDFSGKKCATCGFLYTPGVKVDEDLHTEIHSGGPKYIVHKGWKNERVVFHGDGNQGRIIQISRRSPSTHWEKLTRVCTFIEEEIGLAKSELLKGDCKALLQILDSRVVGCVVFEGNCMGWKLVKVQGKGALVEKTAVGGYPMEDVSSKSFPKGGVLEHRGRCERKDDIDDRMPTPSGEVATSKSCDKGEGSFPTSREINLKPKRRSFDWDPVKPPQGTTVKRKVPEIGQEENVDLRFEGLEKPGKNNAGQLSGRVGVSSCKREKVVRVCGVRVVWVSPGYRRGGVASAMLDVLQSDLVVGKRCKLAFLQQTVDGEQFCNAYLGSKEYWLYTGNPSK